MANSKPFDLCHFGSHHRLAAPVALWERLKSGGGTPPVLTRHGWMIFYHGVSQVLGPKNQQPQLRYSARVNGAFGGTSELVRYRSPKPVLTPELPQERQGTVADVVFPTAIDRRDDLESPNRFDILLRDGRQPDRRGTW